MIQFHFILTPTEQVEHMERTSNNSLLVRALSWIQFVQYELDVSVGREKQIPTN